MPNNSASFQSPRSSFLTPSSVPTTPRAVQLQVPSSSENPAVDLSWVFTPTLNAVELCRLMDTSNVEQKQTILGQVSYGHL